ncbi:hypothetical protein ABZX90_14575 [Streptomyces sp. NPDC002935]|uniref:hypothetical protein n=1 Tax=Streptomyces sp. NPDC002935 TaxID=3154545 RepID=UPI0033AF4283
MGLCHKSDAGGPGYLRSGAAGRRSGPDAPGPDPKDTGRGELPRARRPGRRDQDSRPESQPLSRL